MNETTMNNDSAAPPQAAAQVQRKRGSKRKRHGNRFYRRKGTKARQPLPQERAKRVTGPVEVVDAVYTSGTHNTKTSRQTRSSSRSKTNNNDADNTDTNTDTNNNDNNNTNDNNNNYLRFTGRPLYILIAGFFEQALDSPPASEWAGKGGTTTTIIEALQLPPTRSTRNIVHRVLEKCNSLQLLGKVATEWMVDSDFDPSHRSGRPPVILLHDTTAIECIDEAVRLQMPVELVACAISKAREMAGLEGFGEAAIRGLLNRLGAIRAPVGRRQQGSLEVGTPWARHRWGVALQVLIRAADSAFVDKAAAQAFLQEHVERYLADPLNKDNNKDPKETNGVSGGDDTTNNDNNTTNDTTNNDNNNNDNDTTTNNSNSTYDANWPACFRASTMDPIRWDRVVMVDEKHCQQVVGGDGAMRLQWLIPRDESGKVDKNGEYDAGVRQMHMKYKQEGRFVFLCAPSSPDGTAVKARPYSYTGTYHCC